MVGSLTVFCGCMFSSKSESLIRRLNRAKYEKKKVAAVKPLVDNRYSSSDIVSHSGLKFIGIPISNPLDILDLPSIKEADIVGVDEVQFFDSRIVDVCLTLVGAGKQVLVAGLDMDFRGVPFGPIPTILAVADTVKKLNAACSVCGESANRSQRIVSNEEQVMVGGASAYEARCLTHWSPEPIFVRQDSEGD